MDDYKEIFDKFKERAKSLSDRELLEEIHVMLYCSTFANNEREKLKLYSNDINSQTIKTKKFPDDGFCPIINPMRW